MNRNALGIVEYARELIRSSTTEKVLVDREKLRALVNLATDSPRFQSARSVANKLKAKQNA